MTTAKLRRLTNVGIGIVMPLLFLVSCSSAQIKARKEQRDKIAQSSKIYCQFLNGEVYPDIDIALNLEMAKRCDPDKSMTVTNYRSPSESVGLVFCCSMKTEHKPEPVKKEVKPEVKPEQAPAVQFATPVPATPMPIKEEKH